MKKGNRTPLIRLSSAADDNSSKRRSNSKNRIRAFVSSPTFNVVALVLLLLSVFGGLRYFNARKQSAQISFVETGDIAAERSEQTRSTKLAAPVVFSGEVYSTSLRLREVGALGLAMTLAMFVMVSETGSLPSNINQIWAVIDSRKLMPPGLRFENNLLISDSSAFWIRYQQSPFQFEIVSKPNKTADGPALMLRFPLSSLDGRTITYFQSSSISSYQIPEAFAPLDKVIASGWTMEQWRGEILPENKQNLDLLNEEKQLWNEFPHKR